MKLSSRRGLIKVDNLPGCQEIISIIVPIYKVEPYLKECLDSIAAQTYPFLDIILIDDGSPDGCPDICDTYASKDPRFRVMHKKHEGLSVARNIGLNLTKGTWIGFVDADDWIESDMYEKLIRSAQKYNADMAYCGDRAESGERVQGERIKKKEGSLTPERFLTETLLRRTGMFTVWDKLYRARMFEGIYFPVDEIYEDGAVFIPLLRRAARIAYTGSNSYHYRIREGSILHSGYSSEKRALNRRRLINLKKDVAKYYPNQLPLMKYHEAFNSYQWIELYLRSGGSKKTDEYRELKMRFQEGFPLLFVQDGVPWKDKCKAALIWAGLFGPEMNAFLQRLLRKDAEGMLKIVKKKLKLL